MHHAFRIQDTDYNIELSRGRDGYRLHFMGEVHAIDLRDGHLLIDGQRVPVEVVTRGDDVFVQLDGAAHQLRYEHPLERLAHQVHGAADDHLRAPMPGSLVAVQAKVGERVMQGQALLVMESMKMETTLTAAREGVVAAIHYGPGQTFDRDAVLLSLEPVMKEGS